MLGLKAGTFSVGQFYAELSSDELCDRFKDKLNGLSANINLPTEYLGSGIHEKYVVIHSDLDGVNYYLRCETQSEIGENGLAKPFLKKFIFEKRKIFESIEQLRVYEKRPPITLEQKEQIFELLVKSFVLSQTRGWADSQEVRDMQIVIT